MTVSSQPLWLVILGLGITGSVVGAVIAAVASWMNDRSRRRFEKRRWRAEFYLRPKLESLRTLHAAMVRTHYELNIRAKARMPQNIVEFREQVETRETEFLHALTSAEIYLDQELSKDLRAVLGAVRQMTTSIWLRIPEVFDNHGKHQDAALREPDWRLFTTTFDKAHAKLGGLLNPDELMKWIEE